MKPHSWIKELPLLALLIAPFIAFAIAQAQLPDQVPMHFNAHGNVNRYGSPLELLILPGMNVLVALLLYFIPRLDPQRANILASLKAYYWIRLLIASLFTYIFFLMLATSFNPQLDVQPLIAVGILALFFGLGFAMPGIKQNYLIGIRLPWTLESESNWNATHAFAGKLWSIGSLVGIVLVLIVPSGSLLVALAVLIVLLIWTGIYSYRLFEREKRY